MAWYLFLAAPLQELRAKIWMIFCPIIDGSNLWTSEIAEYSINKG